MKIPKQQVEQVKLSVRVSAQLHAELAAAAHENSWSVNAEINHRLRAGTVMAELRNLAAEVAELKAELRKTQSPSAG